MTFLEALSLPFLQRALVAGALIATGTGLLGVFVVQRRLSFLGDGLAHAAFGGMGIGAFVIVSTGLVGSGLAVLRDPIWIAVPFSLLAAGGIYLMRRRTDLSSDTAIGISFAVTVALGVMFFSLIPPDVNLGVSLMDLLFGSILGVRGPDLIVILAVTLLAGALAASLHQAGLTAFEGTLLLDLNGEHWKAKQLGSALSLLGARFPIESRPPFAPSANLGFLGSATLGVALVLAVIFARYGAPWHQTLLVAQSDTGLGASVVCTQTQ